MKAPSRGTRLLHGLGPLLLVLLAALAGAVWLAHDLAEGRERVIDDQTVLALQKSQFMSQWIGTQVLNADYVLRDINDQTPPARLRAMAGDAREVAVVSAMLAAKLKTLPFVTGLSVYGPDCVFLAAADPRVIGFRSAQKICHQPSGQRLEDKPYLQYVSAERSANHRPSLLVAHQQLSPEGGFLGGALAAIDLSLANDWIQSFPVSGHGLIALVDQSGTLLARNPPLPGTVGQVTALPTQVREMGDTRYGQGFIETSPLDQRERIYGVSKIEEVPLIVLVGFDLADSLAEWQRRAWQLGCGYLALLALIVLALRAHWAMLRQRETLRRMAVTDALTGVANRRQMMEAGARELAALRRHPRPLSLLMIDVDHFKRINDQHGHPAGDQVLQALVGGLQQGLRGEDLLARLGGEEFAVLLRDSDAAQAMRIAERLRAAVEALRVVLPSGEALSLSVSIGAASRAPEDPADFDALLKRADDALYRAKAAGRNRVVGP